MKIFLVVVGLALASASSLAQELFFKKSLFSQFEPAIEKFQSLDKKSTIGGYPILPVTDGMQIGLIKVEYSTGVVVPSGRVVSFAENSGKFFVGLDIRSNLSQAPASDWTDSPCGREDFLWKRSIGGKFADINCVSVNHIVSYFLTSTGEFQQLAVYLKDRKIEVPPTIIRVQFTRYSKDMRRLVYIVDINPELYGVVRDATTPWGSNSWHKEFIKRDQQKVVFLENLKKWAIDVQDRMDEAFTKSPRAFTGLNDLNAYLSIASAASAASADKVEGSNQVEKKLEKIKMLFDKGLLTESQYNDQVKTILGNN